MAQKLIIQSPRRIGFESVPLGELLADTIRVKTNLSAISHGTEMVAWTGNSPHMNRAFSGERIFSERPVEWPPFYPFPYAGYDCAGVVTAVGGNVTRFAVGDRVWHSGNHMDEFILPSDHEELLRLAPGTPDESAVMVNLTSIALAAVVDAAIKIGDNVVIVGGGTVGQLAVQMACLSGARNVFLVELSAARAQFAKDRCRVTPIDPKDGLPVLQIKGLLEGNWPDVVIECSGAVPGLATAIQCAGFNGTVIAAGFYANPATALNLSEEFLHNRVTLKSSMSVWGCQSRHPERWNRQRYLKEALHLIESRKLNLEGFVSAQFAFTEAQSAYETIEKDPARHMKVVLKY